jgi:hypothetical protein
MGYSTEFEGEIRITPPLNATEVAYINALGNTRRMSREKGQYFVGGSGSLGQGTDPDIIDYNRPDNMQPSLWCNWKASEDGTTLQWNGSEKSYEMEKWLDYLLHHIIKPNALAKNSEYDFSFLTGHELNGIIDAKGEDSGDEWKIMAANGKIYTSRHGNDAVWDEVHYAARHLMALPNNAPKAVLELPCSDT